MSDIPKRVTESTLWKRLSQRNDLEHAMKSLRGHVEVLAAKIADLQPGITDHSIIHLDALWEVAEHVLSPDEMQLITAGEAFVLGGAFYLHDIGMAIGAAPDGLSKLQQSEPYKAEIIRLQALGVESDKANTLAIRHAARADHAKFAITLAQGKIPGTDLYLIEDSKIRNCWSESIGQVAASHHWSMNELKIHLGDRDVVPDAAGTKYDLGYVACLLRIIDYAHINMERASAFERLLRPHLPSSSAMHWDAQQNIAGPIRQNNSLIYSSTKQIESVDGWWTFYEMARGLDMEIAAVREYLAERTASYNRFSLEGVKGAKYPRDFSKYVRTHDFEPIDIRFRPDSMERLVELLGGKTLYGNDVFAPIRELLQNARDAIELYRAQAVNLNELEPPRIRISISDDANGRYLEVSDNGIGMSAHVLTNYLLGIASDYWHSSDFYSEHSKGLQRKFSPVGRFGIGFLSVFMLGDSVEVRTQRRGGSMLVLNLNGVGQRGTLKRCDGYAPGTIVRVRITAEDAEKYAGLVDIVRAKAPMLQIPVTVTELGKTNEITPEWWKRIPQGELIDFLESGPSNHEARAFDITEIRKIGAAHFERTFMHRRRLTEMNNQWVGGAPDEVTENARMIAVPDGNMVHICSKGFLVSKRSTNGIIGLIDVEELPLTAARSEILEWDDESFWEQWSIKLNTQLVHALDRFSGVRDITARYPFLVSVGKLYGHKLLTECDLRWLSVRQAPGEIRLVSPKDFVDSLSAEQEILISYGSSVWFAESKIRKLFECTETAPMVLICSTDQPRVGSYDDKKQIIDGELDDHFNVDRYSHSGSRSAVLLKATLDLVAKAWGCQPDSLSATWKRMEQELFGNIKRKTES